MLQSADYRFKCVHEAADERIKKRGVAFSCKHSPSRPSGWAFFLDLHAVICYYTKVLNSYTIVNNVSAKVNSHP